MGEKSSATEITMADFRKSCVERLEQALETREIGSRVHELSHGEKVERFETPSGLIIQRIGSLLTIECDFGDVENQEVDQMTLQFVDEEEYPIEATFWTIDETGTHSGSVPRREQDALAAQLAKYVTLMV